MGRSNNRSLLELVHFFTGAVADAYHRVQMDPEGVEIVRCIEMAIERSGRAREEIGYVNYHGTSTQLNDAIESRCVRRVFNSID